MERQRNGFEKRPLKTALTTSIPVKTIDFYKAQIVAAVLSLEVGQFCTLLVLHPGDSATVSHCTNFTMVHLKLNVEE